MRRRGLALSFVTCLRLLAAPAVPDEALSPRPCRPLFTTSAGPAEPGVLEVETGAQLLLNRDRGSDESFPFQLNLGIWNGFDLRAGWSGPTLRKDAQGEVRTGGGDPVLGAQVLALRQDQVGLDLGLAYWHKVPRASVAKGIGTGRHDDTLLVAASRVMGRWGVDANVGMGWIGDPDGPGRVRQGALSLAVTCALAPSWNLTLDTYALAGTDVGPRAVSSILAVSCDVSPWLCVDAGLEVGLTQGAPRMSFNAGLVWRVGRLW